MRAAIFVCLIALLASSVAAQDAKSPFTGAVVEDFGTPRFAVDVPLVSVAFSVRDRAGRLIRELNREDFQVFEDGAEQQIRHLASERDSPLTMGVLIDFSSSQTGFEDENIYVAMSFFKRILRPRDRAFLVAFGDNIRLIRPPTNSLEELDHGLRRIKARYGKAPRVGPKAKRRGGSAVVDAIYWSAEEQLRKVGGRKALIMIGDGKENSSEKELYDAIEKLQSLDVIFYGLGNE
ncbi:MAG: VWA domain-containing protein, partial [bacterium]|nr:VWA domain-containing protein [bacterium]